MARWRDVDRDAFRSYLSDEGLSPGTIRVYMCDVAGVLGAGGAAARLRDEELAPKTRRRILAAMRRFADFRQEPDMTRQLQRLARRLPAPARKIPKVPLPREEWFALLDEIDTAEYLAEPMRAELGLLASRGFRCADVLRLQRREVTAALKAGTLIYEAKGRRRVEFRLLKTFRVYLETLADHRGWERVEDLISPRSAPGERRRRAAARAVGRALAAVGDEVEVEDLYPHRLRRTYAAEYLRALGPDPEALIKLQQHMQWASLATAMQYVDHQRGAELDVVAEKMMHR